jgi:two-component system response regulator
MIVVIEDNDQDREVIMRALETATPAVRRRLASSVEEAREVVRSSTMLGGVRLILIDADLWDGPALATLQALRTESELVGIPIVLLSSPLEPSELARAYELGARSVLFKPANKEMFEEMLKAAAVYWLGVNLAVTDTRVRRPGIFQARASEHEA